MEAALLAAGLGRRLGTWTEDHPKCLVPIGGRSLLRRHLDILQRVPEIERATFVVGYEAGQLRAEVDAWRAEAPGDHTLPVDFVMNERFREGSILSMYAAKEVMLRSDTIVMDADVLYGPPLMERLVRSPSANCFLLDDSYTPSGEEMVVCAVNGRAMHIARDHDPSTQTGWDAKGEGVGFFRLSRTDAPALLGVIDAHLAAHPERGPGDEYEVALNQFIKQEVCGYERVGDLPWTEVDFPADVVRAEEKILPRIDGVAG